MKEESLREKLQSLDQSIYFEFHHIREDAVELRIDGIGYAGTYSIGYARRICKELHHRWNGVYKD